MRMRAPLFFDAAHSQHGTCATLPWDCDECVCLCEWVDLHGGGSWLVAGLWLLVLGLMSGGVAGDAAMIGLRCCGRKGNCDGWCKCSGSPRVGEVVGVAAGGGAGVVGVRGVVAGRVGRDPSGWFACDPALCKVGEVIAFMLVLPGGYPCPDR